MIRPFRSWLCVGTAPNPTATRRRRPPTGRALRYRPHVDPLEDRTLLNTYTVSNLADSGAGSLRQAILDADGDGGANAIVFAPGMQGTIALTSGELDLTDDMTIAGPGADRIAVSGSDHSRVFTIAAGVTATIDGLAITHGRDTQGAGIDNAGSLTVANAVLAHSQAINDSGDGEGGGIFNEAGAVLVVRGSTLQDNLAFGNPAPDAPDYSGGKGGGIFNDAGASLSVTDSALQGNQAVSTVGSPSHQFGGFGGGIWSGGVATPASLTIAGSTFVGNQALGGFGGGVGYGGAIESGRLGAGDTLTVTGSTFAQNQAVGGNGGTGGNFVGQGDGGAIESHGPTSINASTFTGNQAVAGSGGTGGRGASSQVGFALGGAINHGTSGSLDIATSTFTHNRALGGSGGSGGTADTDRIGFASGGGIFSNAVNSSVTIVNTTIAYNQALGGNGNTPGTGRLVAVGGAQGGCMVIARSNLIIRDSTLTFNQAIGGAGATGSTGGDASGGCIANGNNLPGTGSTVTVINSTLAFNEAVGGAGGAGGNGGSGLGGGLWNNGTAQTSLLGSVIVHNEAIGGAAGIGGDAGQGVGGGIYIVTGGMVCADADTVITGNHASTSDDDVYGDLCSDAGGGKVGGWAEAVTRLFGVHGASTEGFGDLGGVRTAAIMGIYPG